MILKLKLEHAEASEIKLLNRVRMSSDRDYHRDVLEIN